MSASVEFLTFYGISAPLVRKSLHLKKISIKKRYFTLALILTLDLSKQIWMSAKFTMVINVSYMLLLIWKLFLLIFVQFHWWNILHNIYSNYIKVKLFCEKKKQCFHLRISYRWRNNSIGIDFNWNNFVK